MDKEYTMFTEEQRKDYWEALSKWGGLIDAIKAAVQNPMVLETKKDYNETTLRFMSIRKDISKLDIIVTMMQDDFNDNFKDLVKNGKLK